MNAQQLLAQAQAAKEKLVNQSVDNGGDFKYEPPAKGVAMARFVSYIEIGEQEPRVKGPHYKGPKPTAIIQFELLGKKHAKEIEVDGKKRIVYPIITETLPISTSKKSWFYKLLHAMDYGRGNTHMAFMLGEAFKITVLHNEVDKDGKKAIFANIRNDQGWTVGAPIVQKEDDDGEMVDVPLKVPNPTVELRMMLWDAPSQEQWESLFIDGTRTVKDGDKEKEVSKNWIQETILKASDFEGSEIQRILSVSGGDLPGVPSTDPEDDLLDAEDGADGGNEGSGSEGSGDDEGATSGDSEGSADDPLAGLDLED